MKAKTNKTNQKTIHTGSWIGARIIFIIVGDNDYGSSSSVLWSAALFGGLCFFLVIVLTGFVRSKWNTFLRGVQRNAQIQNVQQQQAQLIAQHQQQRMNLAPQQITLHMAPTMQQQQLQAQGQQIQLPNLQQRADANKPPPPSDPVPADIVQAMADAHNKNHSVLVDPSMAPPAFGHVNFMAPLEGLAGALDDLDEEGFGYAEGEGDPYGFDLQVGGGLAQMAAAVGAGGDAQAIHQAHLASLASVSDGSQPGAIEITQRRSRKGTRRVQCCFRKLQCHVGTCWKLENLFISIAFWSLAGVYFSIGFDRWLLIPVCLFSIMITNWCVCV